MLPAMVTHALFQTTSRGPPDRIGSPATVVRWLQGAMRIAFAPARSIAWRWNPGSTMTPVDPAGSVFHRATADASVGKPLEPTTANNWACAGLSCDSAAVRPEGP